MGAPCLWLSGCPSAAWDRQIAEQRLDPEDAIAIDKPSPDTELFYKLTSDKTGSATSVEGGALPDARLFAACIPNRRDFHIDHYETMSFCGFIKDPSLRYDLRQGSFQEAWDEFIPALP